MRFAYYERLSRPDQATYRRSDAASAFVVPARAHPALLAEVEALRRALDAARGAPGGLSRAEPGAVAARCEGICASLSAAFGAPPPAVEVLAVRPSEDWGELHGLYTAGDGKARIRVWMRTAKKGRVVAFRTFLRTLLHELGHHLDFEVLGLEQSFHTEGFFRRESSLLRQLVPEEPGAGGGVLRRPTRRG